MNKIIQPGRNTAPYNNHPAAPYGSKQNQIKPGQFLEMAMQAGKARANTKSSTAAYAAGTKAASMEGITCTRAPSLETMLKAKYPNLVYHVFDASSSYWRTRNDYPHYLLYQPGEKAAETMENWQPSGANPFYGSVDGRFMAPKEIHALGNVPPGSKAVVIHPKVQQRMEQDPEYAREILARIDAWFAFDVARNDKKYHEQLTGEFKRIAAILGADKPSALPVEQRAAFIAECEALIIGEDGNICNAVSSKGGGEITYSGDEMVRAYYLRLAKRADFMRWLAKEHLSKEQLKAEIQDSLRIADQNAASTARSELFRMMNNSCLMEILGKEIAGMPTETVLAITRAQIGGSY